MDYEFVESAYIQYRIEDGILFADYKEMEMLTLAIAKNIIATRKIFTRGRTFPMLLDLTKVKNVSKESMSFFASKDTTEGVSKGAFIVSSSSFARIMFNFFLLIYNPGPSSRLFQSKEEALKWLKKDL